MRSDTVAQNVSDFGVGAINIDATRIGDGSDKMSGGCAGVDPLHGGGIKARAKVDTSVGRWPANLVFQHQYDCTPDHCSSGCVIDRCDWARRLYLNFK